MRLVDFKVRILDSAGGTAATTRVMIESADAQGQALVDHRRVAQHRRRLLQRPVRRHHLQAVPRRGQAGSRVRAQYGRQYRCAGIVSHARRWLTVGAAGRPYIDDGRRALEPSQTLTPPIAVAVSVARAWAAASWRVPHVVAAVPRCSPSALFFWLGAGRYIEHRQCLCEGRPGLYRHRAQRPHRRGAGAREPARLARPAAVPARRQPYRAGARQDRSGDRDPARRDPRPARAMAHQARGDQGGAKPADLRPGRLRAPEGPRRPQVRARRRSSRRSRMGLDVARQRISAARGGPAAHRGAARRRSQDQDRRPSQGQADAGGARRGAAQLRRTTIEAPLDGIVSKGWCRAATRSTGVPSIAVVADTDLWIEANFKETELTRVRVGQPVTINVDTYPDMNAPARSTSLAQSTGAEFAVLPPQNATGNWVKVVQRIPVRTSVNCREGDPPLRVGMSTTIEIDTGHSRSFGEPAESGSPGASACRARRAARQAHERPVDPAVPALRRRRWLTVVVMMATIMQALDGTIANVALPNIQGSLSATQEQVAWVITSYHRVGGHRDAARRLLRRALRRAAHPGRVGDRLHHRLDAVRRRPDAAQLVLFRTLQGVFGAALVPLSQALMMDAYPREEQGKAMAMWGVGTMLGPISGPTLGGWLTDEYHLALGVLHQPAGRHPVRVRPHDPGQEQGERHAAAVRPAGLHRCWRSPSARSSSCSTAASRSTGSAPGDHRRGGGGGRRLRDVRDPHADERPSVPAARPVPRPQPDARAHLHRRHRPA